MKNPTQDYRRKLCRYCDEPLPGAFLDLGTLPLANSYVPANEPEKEEFKCPLSLAWCPRCKLVQLTHTVPPDLMFSHYLYVSSTTKTFQRHFADYAKTVAEKLGKREPLNLVDSSTARSSRRDSEIKSRDDSRRADGETDRGIVPSSARDGDLSSPSRERPLAVDIGSNDGLLVRCYRNEGMRALGVEPAKNLADEANRQGVKTLNRYFDAECVKTIRAKEGPADVISGNNVFAHIDAIQDVCKNVQALLSDRGIFVIEFPYLGKMLDELLFDMIYHEHAAYIAVTPLKYLLNRFGLDIFDIQEVSSHGGSLRVFIQKTGGPFAVEPVVGEFLKREKDKGYLTFDPYEEFARRVMRVKKDFLEVFAGLRQPGKTVAGYGAPAKASTLINFYGLTASDIAYVVDDNPLKQNYFVPGARIPIVPNARLAERAPDYLIIFAWNFAREIMAKIGSLSEKGTRFIVPLPIGNAGPELRQSYELAAAAR